MHVCDYLPNGVSLVIADGQRVVITSQSQQVLRTPAPTGDLFGVFT